TDTQIDVVKMKENQLKINGKIFTKTNVIESLNLQFKSREGDEVLTQPLNYQLLKSETNRRFGLRRYRYKGHLDFNEHIGMLKEGIYDAFLIVKYKKAETIEVRLGTPRYRARRQYKSS